MLPRYRSNVFLYLLLALSSCTSPLPFQDFQTHFGGIVYSSVVAEYLADGSTVIARHPLSVSAGRYFVRLQTAQNFVAQVAVGELGNFSLDFREKDVLGDEVPTEFDATTRYVPITFDLLYKDDNGSMNKVATLSPATLVASQDAGGFTLIQRELRAGIYRVQYQLAGATHQAGLGIYTRSRTLKVDRTTGHQTISGYTFAAYSSSDPVIWMTAQPDMIY